jgi:GNAT superfamily N-acetyltransferase
VAAETEPEADVLDGTVMRLREPSGGTLVVERPALPFTPTEFARARALVELDARLGARLPEDRDVRTLAEGNEITIRRAGPEDLAAARDLHGRCSRDTLTARYHGPVADVDRYLEHLLSPRFGRSLAVESPSGRIVALGHLLWDGDENEVALLVEDAWQGRGIGSALLRELVGLAEEAGRESVYAVTKATNATMVATMRSLGLPLDHQVEDGTLVITATLDARRVSTPAR